MLATLLWLWSSRYRNVNRPNRLLEEVGVIFVYKCHLSEGIRRIYLTRNGFGLQRNYRKKLERLQAQNRYPMPRSKFRFWRRVRMNRAMAAMAAAGKAPDVALRAAVRTAMLTAMAPSWAKAVATAAAARSGMNKGILSGLVGDKEKAPWSGWTKGACGGWQMDRFECENPISKTMIKRGRDAIEVSG